MCTRCGTTVRLAACTPRRPAATRPRPAPHVTLRRRAGFGSIAIVIKLDTKEGAVTAEMPEAAVSSDESNASKTQRRCVSPTAAAASPSPVPPPLT